MNTNGKEIKGDKAVEKYLDKYLEVNGYGIIGSKVKSPKEAKDDKLGKYLEKYLEVNGY